MHNRSMQTGYDGPATVLPPAHNATEMSNYPPMSTPQWPEGGGYVRSANTQQAVSAPSVVTTQQQPRRVIV